MAAQPLFSPRTLLPMGCHGKVRLTMAHDLIGALAGRTGRRMQVGREGRHLAGEASSRRSRARMTIPRPRR